MLRKKRGKSKIIQLRILEEIDIKWHKVDDVCGFMLGEAMLMLISTFSLKMLLLKVAFLIIAIFHILHQT